MFVESTAGADGPPFAIPDGVVFCRSVGIGLKPFGQEDGRGVALGDGALARLEFIGGAGVVSVTAIRLAEGVVGSRIEGAEKDRVFRPGWLRQIVAMDQ